MGTKFTRTALACALAALTLAACDRASMDRADKEGAAIGQKANEALARTKEGLTDAGRKARDTLSGATSNNDSTAKTAPREPADANAQKHSARDTGMQTREALGDAAITASIKTDFLKDPDLSVFKIDVDTKDGVVTLNGLADNDDARNRAQHLAEGVKGVREVRNFLVTKKA
jgi:osmotically-inducible protein OsmY